MLEEQISDQDFIDIIYFFSEYKIQTKYLPLMFESSLIMEAINLIFILCSKGTFNSEDLQLIKNVLQENFRFFSELERYEFDSNSSNNQYRKIKFFLSVVFFSLMLLSGIGCFYSVVVFIPLAIIFSLCLVLYTCLINFKRHPVEIIQSYDDVKKGCKSELNILKINLNNLRSFFAEKYQIKMTNVDDVYVTLAEEHSEDSPKRKKSVTFAPTLNEYNLFNIDTPESRSRANSYENPVNLRPKG